METILPTKKKKYPNQPNEPKLHENKYILHFKKNFLSHGNDFINGLEN